MICNVLFPCLLTPGLFVDLFTKAWLNPPYMPDIVLCAGLCTYGVMRRNVSPKKVCSRSNPQYLWMWTYLGTDITNVPEMQRRTHQENIMGWQGQRMEWCSHKPRVAGSHQELGLRAGTDPPQSVQKELTLPTPQFPTSGHQNAGTINILF